MTFDTYTRQYEELVLPLKKRATKATFAGHLRALREPFGGLELTQLGYPDVQKYFTNLAGRQAARSVHNRWAAMRVVLRQAQRENLIVALPEPVLPKTGRVAQEWLTIEQMRALLQATTDPALYWLLCETGMRIGEAQGLQAGDLKGQILTIQRSVFNGVLQAPKTGSAYRSIAVSRRLRDLLAGRNLDCDPTAFTFRTSTGRPIWLSKTLAEFKRSCCHAGVPEVGFHACRRGNITFAAQVLRVPEAILSYRVGHRAATITLGVYNQPIIGIDLEWAEKMAKALETL